MEKILVFVQDGYGDFEVSLALHFLKNVAGKKIITVGYSLDPVTSIGGLKIIPDITLDDAMKTEDAQALLLPGGAVCERNDRLVPLIQTLNNQNKLIAAICYGPQYLAGSGLLETHRYTTSCRPENYKERQLDDPFPRKMFTDERVVTDGNIITAKGHAFVDFAYAVLNYLGYDPNLKSDLELFRKDVVNLKI